MFNTFTILYFFAWLFVFLRFVRRNRQLGVYGTIVLSYVVYASLSIFDYVAHSENYSNITLFPFLYLFALLLIALKPIKNYDEKRNLRLKSINPNICYIVFSFFLISTIIVLPASLEKIQHGWTLMLASDDGAIDLYNEMHSRDTQNANINGGILGICNIIRYLLYEICVFLLFYYLTLPKRNKIIIIALLFSFLLNILVSFSNGGRTGSTMDAFTILMTYLIFYQFLNPTVKKIAKRCFIVLGVSFMLLTLAMTISRTVYREGGTSDGIVDYLGQGNLYFNQYAIDSENLRGGDRTCNVFKRLLGFENVPPSISGVRVKHSSMKLSDHNFSTFIGDFVLDFGPFITALIIIFFSSLFCIATRPRSIVIRIDQLLLIQLAADICMHGGMYLFYYSFSGNYILLMYIIFFFILRLYSNSKKNVLLVR